MIINRKYPILGLNMTKKDLKWIILQKFTKMKSKYYRVIR